MIERAPVEPEASSPRTHRLGEALRDALAKRLSGFAVRTIEEDGLRRAAVAIVVTAAAEGEPASILLTLRSARLKRHANQFALPGGRLDAGETNEQAACRETREELGLALDAGDVLGRIDDYPTVSGFAIAPIVLWGGVRTGLHPDPEEVAEVYNIPLAELDGPGMPVLEPADDSNHPLLTARLPSLGHQMFSPTAAILYQFREVALRGAATRVAHYGQPRFAWK